MLRRTTSIFIGLSLFVVFTFSSFAKMTDGKILKKIISTKDTLTELRTVVINQDYSLELQKHMYAATTLSDDMSLHYEDTLNELYILVIDQSKADFIRDFQSDSLYDPKKSVATNYRNLQIISMRQEIQILDKEKITPATIHKCEAEIADFTAIVPNIEPTVAYKIAFVEGPVKLYMIMTWTLAEYKEKHSVEMDQMVRSFQVLK